ncbi:MlaD family protein [Actinocorallia populi]|uniref:MlaD family protein n=1 Tax=Actinocorallia populi TaxID=2079200 RepID=UPI000D08C8EF|nr:MlaD family protein [Actinocorallia populi]
MRLKSFRDRNPVVLGLVSTAAIALLLVAVFLVGSLGLLQSRYTLTGVFTDTGGLHSGNDVKVAGIKVGEVTAVEPDFSRGTVLITWEVDSGVDLGPRTRAEVRTSNILGGRYLRLSGPVAEPHLAGLPDERRRIPLERTQTPTTVNDLLATGTRSLADLDTELISDVIDQVGGISPRTKERLVRSLRNLTDLADTLEGSGPRLERLVSDSDRVLKLARAKDAQLAALARNIQKLLDELRDRQLELSVLLGSGDAAVTRISKLISRQQTDLIELVDSLDGVVGRLDPQIGELNTLLAWMGPTLSAFNASNSHGPWVDAIGTQLGLLSAEDIKKLTQGMGGGR